MTQPIPTTKALYLSTRAKIEGALGVVTAILPKAVTDVFSKATAGETVLLYKYGGSIQLNLMPSKASLEDTQVNGETINPANEWGELIGAGPRKGATQAVHTIAIGVKQQVGELRKGSQLVRLPTGIVYTLDEAVPLDAATVSGTVTAVADPDGGDGAGSVGNLSPGDVLTFANPLAAVVREATVTARTVDGADREDGQVYRRRYTRQFRRRKRGGAYADYQAWAESVAGILNVYPQTGDDPNIVNLYCEATEESSGSPDGIPTSAQLSAVENAVNLDEAGKLKRRPVGHYVQALPITRVGFSVEVAGLEGVEDKAATIATVQRELEGHMLSRESYILGLTDGPRKDRITAAEVGGIISSVVNAAGGSFSSFILRKGVDQITAYTLEVGEKAKLTGASEV